MCRLYHTSITISVQAPESYKNVTDVVNTCELVSIQYSECAWDTQHTLDSSTTALAALHSNIHASVELFIRRYCWFYNNKL